MSIAPGAPREVPEYTTLESYTVNRLGLAPSLVCTFVETVRELSVPLPVTGLATTEEGLVVGLLVAEWPGPASPLHCRAWLSDGTALGRVTSYDAATGTLRVETTPGALPEAPAIVVQRRNPFGGDAVRPADGAQRYTLELSSQFPTQAARMGQMLGGIVVELVLATLSELGEASHTTGAVVAALTAMAARAENLDYFIGRQCEQLEADRRAHLAFPTVSGAVPPTSAPAEA